jgi:hypothetical protein
MWQLESDLFVERLSWSDLVVNTEHPSSPSDFPLYKVFTSNEAEYLSNVQTPTGSPTLVDEHDSEMQEDLDHCAEYLSSPSHLQQVEDHTLHGASDPILEASNTEANVPTLAPPIVPTLVVQEVLITNSHDEQSTSNQLVETSDEQDSKMKEQQETEIITNEEQTRFNNVDLQTKYKTSLYTILDAPDFGPMGIDVEHVHDLVTSLVLGDGNTDGHAQLYQAERAWDAAMKALFVSLLSLIEQDCTESKWDLMCKIYSLLWSNVKDMRHLLEDPRDYFDYNLNTMRLSYVFSHEYEQVEGILHDMQGRKAYFIELFLRLRSSWVHGYLKSAENTLRHFGNLNMVWATADLRDDVDYQTTRVDGFHKLYSK